MLKTRVPLSISEDLQQAEAGVATYRALFPFDARNPDELTLTAEDIVMVGKDTCFCKRQV